MLLAGRRTGHWSERSPWDFFDLKGIVQSVGAPFELEDATWSEPDSERPWLHPGIQAVWGDDETLAEAGRLHPKVAQELELEGPILVAEIDWEAIASTSVRAPAFEEFSSHPPVDRDLAVVVDEDISYRAIAEAIEAYRARDAEFDTLAESVELFDVYEGPQVGEGERSLAFSVRYRASDRTLTEEEVEPLDEGLADWLRTELGAERR